ncbi:lysine-arginine-ornithine-binding periplasmic protein precursor [Vibrio variabilis]|uniref:Lysine-arginine-ornithine-binding periplasmic protein n=1 Tax=Vibrio variabilis TaxID=990271 RepID=A0ABQ0JDY3_9VIBR|nr:lysine-arginine-ornithine-binding periplasmic protein precursor [Vibrio variabilis]
MKKIITSIVCISALFMGSVQAKEVRLASDFTYPPFNYKDRQGQPVGFDIEIADACVLKLS